uniref:Uncharacterized protein n=3 Tax=Oryza TaxID=4527 RepID=A0A0D3ELZ4_9ORYZ
MKTISIRIRRYLQLVPAQASLPYSVKCLRTARARRMLGVGAASGERIHCLNPSWGSKVSITSQEKGHRVKQGGSGDELMIDYIPWHMATTFNGWMRCLANENHSRSAVIRKGSPTMCHAELFSEATGGTVA